MNFGGNKLPEKLTRTVLQYSSLTLKFHVKLKNDIGVFHSEFSYGNNKYINVNANGFLTLEVAKSKDNTTYDPTRSFMIGIGNIGIVIGKLKKVRSSIYKHEIFALKNNTVIAYDDMVKKYTEQVKTPRINQALLIRPSVVYDEDETSYEGVTIYVNNTANIIQLSIDEFDNLIYVLDKFDIFNSTQLMLNYYMTYVMNSERLHTVTIGKSASQQMKSIDWGLSNIPPTTSNFRKNNDGDIMDDIN